jgi:hypothetical protein
MSDDTEAEEEEKPEKAAKKLTIGPLTAKKLATWIIAAAAVVAALAGLGSQLGSWMKMGLGIDHLEGRVGLLESRVTQLETQLATHERQPNANRRLDDALPTIANALRDSRKDRQRLTHATTRLATIHEFGLDARRAREMAQEVHRTMATDEPGATGPSGDDPIADLEGL